MQVVRHLIPFGNLKTNWEEHTYDKISMSYINFLGLEGCAQKQRKRRNKGRKCKGENNWDAILPIPSNKHWSEMPMVSNKLGISTSLNVCVVSSKS